MPSLVCMGAGLTCTQGVAPSALITLPVNKVLTGVLPAANIMDFKPFVNIPTFGMCRSPANPSVAAATAAALGVLTPMPCVPVPVAPWTPGCPKVLIGNMPALTNTSKCMCAWAGMISITSPGQMKAQA